jgi:FkbM family methyltransferase
VVPNDSNGIGRIHLRKRYLWLLVPAVLAGVRFVPKMVAGPEVRTRAYFAIQRQWMAGWPFETGKYAPRVLLPAALPVIPVWYQVEPHIKMQLDPEDMVSRVILESGEWEPGSWKLMAEHLAPGGTFVDVGAQIGYYSLKAGPVVGASGHVIAVEPNPETISKLRGNIAASGASMIAVAPVACSDSEAMLDLFAAPEANTGETSLSKANASQTGAVAQAYRVRARPLDDIVREAGLSRVDVIKIDVEGAEYLVLKGGQQTLDRFHPMVLVEVVERQLRAMGTSSAELTALLSAHGYRAGRRDGDNIEFLPATDLSVRKN